MRAISATSCHHTGVQADKESASFLFSLLRFSSFFLARAPYAMSNPEADPVGAKAGFSEEQLEAIVGVVREVLTQTLRAGPGSSSGTGAGGDTAAEGGGANGAGGSLGGDSGGKSGRVEADHPRGAARQPLGAGGGPSTGRRRTNKI